MKKILFCNFDMKGGGAEKVLINLLRGLNPQKYDTTLFLIFGVGVHMEEIPSYVKVKCLFRRQFRGFPAIMRLFSPRLLHKLFIRESYDLEIAYLETSPTRIISGAPDDTKKICWVHTDEEYPNAFKSFFRSKEEMEWCYNQFDKIAFVSQKALHTFEQNHPKILTSKCVMYNVVDIAEILQKAKEKVDIALNQINVCSIGRLTRLKGYDRLLQVIKELNEVGLKKAYTLYLLGRGEEEASLKKYIKDNDLTNVVMLGFHCNPYKYLAKMDLFVCSSINEGFSTAVTESIVLNVPVITTDCSGMNEILEDGKYGMIVPNNTQSLYEGLKDLIEHRSKIDVYRANILNNNNKSHTENLQRYEELIDNI